MYVTLILAQLAVRRITYIGRKALLIVATKNGRVRWLLINSEKISAILTFKGTKERLLRSQFSVLAE